MEDFRPQINLNRGGEAEYENPPSGKNNDEPLLVRHCFKHRGTGVSLFPAQPSTTLIPSSFQASDPLARAQVHSSSNFTGVVMEPSIRLPVLSSTV